MSASFEAIGDPHRVEDVRELVESAASSGRPIGGLVDLGRGEGRGYLKASGLRGKARVRHAVRELVLRRPHSRLAEHENLEWLRRHGFRAPRPLAAGVVRRFGIVGYQFLLTEEVRDARTLVQIREEGGGLEHAVLPSIAHEVARMHGLGFVHRNLFARNILITTDGKIWFLDVWRGGARFQLRGAAYDVACFLGELPSDEHGAFLRAYAAAQREPITD